MIRYAICCPCCLATPRARLICHSICTASLAQNFRDPDNYSIVKIQFIACCIVRHAAKCSNGRLTGMWRSWLVQQASSDEWVAAGSCQVMPCQAAGSWPQLALADRSHAGGGPPRNIDLVIHLHAGAPGHGPQTTLHSVASANKSRKSYSPELSNRNHSNLSKKWE